MEKIKNIYELAQLKDKYQKEFAKIKLRVLVCAGTGCVAGGSLDV